MKLIANEKIMANYFLYENNLPGPPRRILASQGPQYRVGIICPPLVEIGLRWLPKLDKDQSLASLAAVAALQYI